jgi:hypothetical protein
MPLGRALLPLAFAVAAAAMPMSMTMRLYRNDAARVHSFEPPPSWQPAPQASYPRLLVSYSHPDGGRLTLTTQKIAPGTSADALAAAAAPLLLKQGFSDLKRADDNGRARLDARLDDRRFLKQLYVVDGAQAWVISLVAGTINQPQMERDFESAVRSLVIAPQ